MDAIYGLASATRGIYDRDEQAGHYKPFKIYINKFNTYFDGVLGGFGQNLLFGEYSLIVGVDK